jgi:zinc/manganese transport system substrate-binding protein
MSAPLRVRCIAAVCVVGAPLVLAGCSGGPAAPSGGSGPSAAPPCPTPPVKVVVSVDQWGDIVSTLGGSCATVKTVLLSSSVDPHHYEPGPADAEDFSHAQLVVVNGVGYDVWASKLAATSAPKAPVVSAGAVTGTPDGANPHLWYRPSAVTAVADAVTAQLSTLDPAARDYFTTQRSVFENDQKPYHDLIAKIKAQAAGKSYASTGIIFYYMGEALGLVNATPRGYQRASANGNDAGPSPADIEAFRSVLAHHQTDVLIYNVQTQGAVPEQIRAAAEQAGVPVVPVTETVAKGANSFQSWQDDQLDRLAGALGVAG